ncbi:hypothetical protein ACFHWW_24745 [Ensifer sp. P24N7]|uniref:hypothetical protein n=1 Tax=Sinorhizobium sp. P24N7 TaxID=3348358 RepID=UPI0035F31600
MHLALDVMLPAARDALKAKHMLLKKGIGWGNMPEPMVRDDIESGRLVHSICQTAKAGHIAFKRFIVPTRRQGLLPGF